MDAFFQFTCASGLRLSKVEGLSAELTKQRLRSGVFSILDLQAAISRYLAEHKFTSALYSNSPPTRDH